jgi:hypothetical protein
MTPSLTFSSPFGICHRSRNFAFSHPERLRARGADSAAAVAPVPAVAPSPLLFSAAPAAVPAVAAGNQLGPAGRGIPQMIGNKDAYPVASHAETVLRQGRHPTVTAFVQAADFKNHRNRKEARTIAAALDAFLLERDQERAFAVLLSRLAALQSADKNNNWEVATKLELLPSDEDASLVPPSAMAEAQRQVRLEQKVRKSDKSGKGKNGKYRKDSDSEEEDPSKPARH